MIFVGRQTKQLDGTSVTFGKRSFGKIMFSVVCVCHSVHGEGVPDMFKLVQLDPTNPLPSQTRSTWTSLLDCGKVGGWHSSEMPYYRLQRSCSKVTFLHLSVILFTGGGVPYPPGRHPLGRHHQETATAADGTHPTGMLSC